MSGAMPLLPIYILTEGTRKPLPLQEKNRNSFVNNLQRRITNETRKLIEGRWRNNRLQTDSVSLWVRFSLLFVVKWKVGGKRGLCNVLKNGITWLELKFGNWWVGRREKYVKWSTKRGISFTYSCIVLRHVGGERKFWKGSGCKLIKSLPLSK